MTDPYCFDANNDYYLMREQGCKMCSDTNPLLNFFLITSVTGVSCLFAMMFVAIFVYGPHVEKLKNEEEEPFKIPFEFKYPIKFAKNSNDLENIENCSVFCTTPSGEVYMKYSKDNEGFDYWCSKKDIKYKYLETVARKFVTMFKCADLYIMKKATNVYFDLLNDTAYKLIDDILYKSEIDLAGNYVGDFEILDVSESVTDSDVDSEEEESDEEEEGEEKESGKEEIVEDEQPNFSEKIVTNVEKIMEKLNNVHYKFEKEDDIIIVKKYDSETKEEEEEDSDDDLFVNSKVEKKMKVRVPELIVANKYRYKGKVEDVILLKKVEKKEKKMDFKSWKKSWF